MSLIPVLVLVGVSYHQTCNAGRALKGNKIVGRSNVVAIYIFIL